MTTPATVQVRISRLAERCAAAGLPVTPQRRTVMEVVAGRADHPTVDQIFSAVAARLPDISRATVYRSLEVLIELGLLERVEHSGSAVRFDAHMEPHHHFLCTRCGALADLPAEAIAGHESLEYVGGPPAVARRVCVIVRGTCGPCVLAG